jgi:hypothetical protein
MAIFEKIKSEKELLKKLYLDISSTKNKKILVFAGHFPFEYFKDKELALESFKKWGIFSTYTLELGCKVAKYSKEKGKKVEFVFWVDDHAYEPEGEPSWMKTRRRRLYQLRSGPKAVLPKKYKKIMAKYGFSEKDILKQNHGKHKRMNCLYFSEKILRAYDVEAANPCAKEYQVFFENPEWFNKKTTYLVAFIPQRCRDNICNHAINIKVKDLNCSHVFLDTNPLIHDKKEIYNFGRGVLYKKD